MPGAIAKRGDRVSLRKLEREDLEFWQRGAADPELRHLTGISKARNRRQKKETYNRRDAIPRMGVIRTLQFVGTLVIVGPLIVIGVFQAIEGEYQQSLAFLGVAIAFIIVSEYLYLSLVDRTVGRLKRLRNVRNRDE